MNPRLRKTTARGAVCGVLFLAAAQAQADRPGAVYDYARVVDVNPIVRIVTVTTPERECWNEEREYRVARRSPGSAGGALVGAIVGGVIGHQFGSGSGNDAATAAGALIGAAVGSDSARRRGAGDYEDVYTRPVRRCRTNYSAREEERIEGYDVTYRYHGQTYRTRMPFDPGERLRIRVDVRPAE